MFQNSMLLGFALVKAKDFVFENSYRIGIQIKSNAGKSTTNCTVPFLKARMMDVRYLVVGPWRRNSQRSSAVRRVLFS